MVEPRPTLRHWLRLLGLVLLFGPFSASAYELTRSQRELREIYKELIEIDTTHSTGSTDAAAKAVARRLRTAGLSARDLHIVGPRPRRQNLVARLRGASTQPPLLLLAHLDVVEARREDWSMDPFRLHESDGFFYARGALDDKAMAAMFTQIVIELRREGTRPRRDIILALTADEEGGPDNGVEWLLANRRDLVDAGLVINEGGGGRMQGGRYLQNGIQASEKTYMTFEVDIRDKGGHSSLPTADNAIYRLAEMLRRLQEYEFPVELNEVTRAFFARSARIEEGQLGQDMLALLEDPPNEEVVRRLTKSPSYNAALRTTCVPTRLEAGHADNALPQSARATINCRVMPGHSMEEIHATLSKVIWDDAVSIVPTEKDTSGPAIPVAPELLSAVEEVTQVMWPGVPTIPMMSSGATDSRYFRRAGIPAYGVSGIFVETDDMRAHGRDERVGVTQFYQGFEFLRRLVAKLAL